MEGEGSVEAEDGREWERKNKTKKQAGEATTRKKKEWDKLSRLIRQLNDALIKTHTQVTVIIQDNRVKKPYPRRTK